MWEYSEKVRDHYINPRNVGEVEKPDGVGEVGNIKCGDALRLTFKLDKDEKISDIKFKTFGCGSAIAASSMLTEICKGKSLEEASNITNKDIADMLGGLPPAKMHCSVMGQEALQAAIKFYRSGGTAVAESERKGTVICSCFNVTDLEIEEAIRHNNLTTVEDVTHFTKAGGGCGGCIPEIQKILDSINGLSKKAPSSVAVHQHMTTLEKIDKIRQVLDAEVRPILQKDGGDCELVDVDGNTVFIRFTGHCAGCAFAGMTQHSVVEDALKKRVLPGLTVKQAQ
jgi:NifU-like protein